MRWIFFFIMMLAAVMMIYPVEFPSDMRFIPGLQLGLLAWIAIRIDQRKNNA